MSNQLGKEYCMNTIVYHGATQIVERPLCKLGRPNLDFDDRVIDTIKFFIGGIMDEQSALRQLAFHKPNNQICIANQDILDRHLTYDRTISI